MMVNFPLLKGSNPRGQERQRYEIEMRTAKRQVSSLKLKLVVNSRGGCRLCFFFESSMFGINTFKKMIWIDINGFMNTRVRYRISPVWLSPTRNELRQILPSICIELGEPWIFSGRYIDQFSFNTKYDCLCDFPSCVSFDSVDSFV